MNKEELWKWVMVVALIIIAYILVIFNNSEKNKLLNLKQTYVIGIITDIQQPARGGKIIKFRYNLFDKVYDKQIGKPVDKDFFIGGRYLVSIPERYFEKGIFLFDKPVPNGVKAPVEGWIELPNFDN